MRALLPIVAHALDNRIRARNCVSTRSNAAESLDTLDLAPTADQHVVVKIIRIVSSVSGTTDDVGSCREPECGAVGSATRPGAGPQ